MKLSIQVTNILGLILGKLKSNHVIKNYLMTVNLSSRIEVKLHVATKNSSLIDRIFDSKEFVNNNEGFILADYRNLIDIEQISEENESEESIKLIFEASNEKHPHLNYNIRRRFHDLLDLHSHTENNPCPVITFYSYKGGVGRTTLLTCYAQYLANKGKQVIIIDCDFEAPGFTNYFGYRFGDESQDEFGNETKSKYGLIEYILDRQFLYPQGKKAIKEKLISRLSSDYSYKVGSEYLNNDKGSIRVVKAGNYETNNLENYLEGLARLDIGNVEVFQEVLEDFKDKDAFGLDWDNSVVLIDSRTGFNDTFATLYAISNLVVGVFGTNTQSQTGLSYVLDNFLRIEKDENGNTKPMNKEFLFVQSFSANTGNKTELWEIAESHFMANPDRFGLGLDKDKVNGNGVPHQKRFYYFPKTDEMAKIGENSMTKSNEIELYKSIEEDRVASINRLYTEIDRLTDEQAKKQPNYTKQTHTKVIQIPISNNFAITKVQENSIKNLLQAIEIPEIRAENIEQNDKKRLFYLRRNLVDVFNWDKLIISGSKGTGKTFIYECMEIPRFQWELCGEANKEYENYFFVNIVPVLDEKVAQKQVDKAFFYTSWLAEYENTSNFYPKFWVVYMANKIFNKPEIIKFIENNSFDLSWCFKFESNQDYANKLWEIINNNQKFTQVEKQLLSLNKLLVKHNKAVLLFLDQLDHLVEPEKWDTWIYELVRYWRANSFSHILPKIFLRSDLIRAKFIKGVNSTEIFRKSISIEWTKEELFAYFFGLQLDANADLYSHFEKNLTSHPARKTILEKLEEYKNFATQIPAEKEILEPLVNIFFGYSAHKTDSNDLTFNSSYNWFAYNLKDGNDDLSLRPFLWLLEKSKEIAMADENYQSYSAETNTILGARYFADFKAMEYAGNKYYDELELEQGNDVLKHFRQFLRIARIIKRVGNYELSEFHELLTLFIKEKQAPLSALNMDNIQKITSFLQNNGIIREKRIKGGKFTNYEIPFLYKYYLLFDNA